MKWSEKEIQFLREQYELMGCAYCAEQLNRSQVAVSHKASRLKLNRRKTGRKPRILIKDGYIWLSYEGGQEPLHRMIMELTVGRKITSQEIVHHKDGNSWNNNPENLEIVNRATHMKLHEKERDSKGRFV